MKSNGAKTLLAQVCTQAKELADIAKTAMRNGVSLRGDNHYGNKFHKAIIAITTTITTLESAFGDTGDQSVRTSWLKFKNSCECLKSLDADRTTRAAALKSVNLVCQTEILPALESIFSAPAPLSIEEQADIGRTPRLASSEIESARRMAQLYIIIHCYENSARQVVDEVMRKKLGDSWWQTAASAPMKQKVIDRQAKEKRSKWITPRGTSPLYYIDWGDLITIIRRFEADFQQIFPDYNFVATRFEEMERFRNIVAHNGTLSSDDDFQHVVISFKQWCKQLS